MVDDPMAAFATPTTLRFPHAPLPTEETIYGQDVPRMMVRCISNGWFQRAEQHPTAQDGDRFLVRRERITYHEIHYIVDYISAKVLGVWFRYMVVYRENHDSPFPPTIDYRPLPSAPPVLGAPLSSSQLFLASSSA